MCRQRKIGGAELPAKRLAERLALQNVAGDERIQAKTSATVIVNPGSTSPPSKVSSGLRAPMGVTGFVELVGLGIWGVHLTRLMLARRQLVAANVE